MLLTTRQSFAIECLLRRQDVGDGDPLVEAWLLYLQLLEQFLFLRQFYLDVRAYLAA